MKNTQITGVLSYSTVDFEVQFHRLGVKNSHTVPVSPQDWLSIISLNLLTPVTKFATLRNNEYDTLTPLPYCLQGCTEIH
jgi:hypothetical protein